MLIHKKRNTTFVVTLSFIHLSNAAVFLVQRRIFINPKYSLNDKQKQCTAYIYLFIYLLFCYTFIIIAVQFLRITVLSFGEI